MSGLRDVLHHGFPVTTRLCELPGYATYVEEEALAPRERGFLGDFLVVVDAEALDTGASFRSLFEAFLERTREELGLAWAA